jgi:preprotein translocase subunit SecG
MAAGRSAAARAAYIAVLLVCVVVLSSSGGAGVLAITDDGDGELATWLLSDYVSSVMKEAG